MHWATRFCFCIGLLVTGYFLGSSQSGNLNLLRADQQSDPLPAAIRDRVREADRSITDAMQLLQDEKRYVPAIRGMNAFATSIGGVDAIADLEAGQGVDPETFAGLYAGQALEEVKEQLARDAEGHITYKNKIVRMYNGSRLKELFTARADFVPPPSAAPAKRDTAKKQTAATDKSDKKDE